MAGYHDIVYRVMVDDWNWERVAEFNWRWIPTDLANGSMDPGNRGYVVTGNRPLILLHRFIMRVTDPNLDVHHKDNNTINNLEENLEILTKSQHSKLHMGERLW